MKRLDRLVAMMLVLQQRRATPVPVLAERFGVTRRTAYRDLSALDGAGFPLTRLASGYGVPEGFRLPPLTLTPREATALLMGGQLVRTYTDPGLKAAADVAVAKLEGVLPPPVRAYAKTLTGVVELRRRRTKSFAAGPVALLPLQQAIAGRRVLRVRYAGSRDLPERAVEPLGLIFSSEHWYLVAYCRARKDMRTFRADRITRAEPLGETFTPPVGFTLDAFLREDAGRKPPSMLVKLKVSPAAARRFQERMPFRVAAERRLGRCKRLAVKSYGVEDAVSLALSLGSEVEVLGPPVIRQWVARELETLCGFYRRHGR